MLYSFVKVLSCKHFIIIDILLTGFRIDLIEKEEVKIKQ